MNLTLSSELQRAHEVISRRLGLTFAPQRWADLQRGINAAAAGLGFKDGEACVAWLSSAAPTDDQIRILAEHLTVGETYFFREPACFRLIEEHILPKLMHKRRGSAPRLRLWSAGCCTGEEAYSLAIALTRVIPDWEKWDIQVLGTDINPQFLKRASSGVFSEWSFRDVPDAVKAKYFTRTEQGGYVVVPYLRSLVKFAYRNLADETWPSATSDVEAMDIILCRNVFIYLERAQAARIANRLSGSLADKGWLFVGAAETSQTLFSELSQVRHAGVFSYRKISGPQRSVFRGEAAPDQMPPPTTVPFVASIARYEGRSAAQSSERARLLESAVSERPRSPSPASTTDASRESSGVEADADKARRYADSRELPEALRACERAIAADKLNPKCHFLHAVILQECNEPLQAAASLKRTIYLDPNFVMAHFALGHLDLRRGDYTAAAARFGRVRSLLRHYHADQTLPESDGITAGRMAEIVETLARQERAQ